MTGQECGEQRVITGVNVTCHRTRQHKGPHASSTYGTRWRDTGEVLPPPRPATSPRPPMCNANGCTLWRDHAGPHGRQDALL